MSEHTPENDAAARIAALTKDGFAPYEHEVITVGARVRNRGQQYREARERGTAEVIWVGRKPGSWEHTWGRLNIEVVVRRDDGAVTNWADYGTFVIPPEVTE